MNFSRCFLDSIEHRTLLAHQAIWYFIQNLIVLLSHGLSLDSSIAPSWPSKLTDNTEILCYISVILPVDVFDVCLRV